MTAVLNNEQGARERFERDTAEHEMTVLHADGLYRHLRFQKPGTSFYWYDLVTWPGSLVIRGDMGTYVFARLDDMFQFFASGGGQRINPHYWGEKLQAPSHRDVEVYSHDRFRQRVEEWIADETEGLDDFDQIADLRIAVDEQLLEDEDVQHSEDAAHIALRDFEHGGVRIGDSWEWDLRDYDPTFLWNLWAIARGVDRYRTAVTV